jgi:hypothetical protein
MEGKVMLAAGVPKSCPVLAWIIHPSRRVVPPAFDPTTEYSSGIGGEQNPAILITDTC